MKFGFIILNIFLFFFCHCYIFSFFAIVTFFFFFFFFLQKGKVTVLPNLPYSPDLAPCELFLSPKLKTFHAGWWYRSSKALGSAVYQYLTSIPNQRAVTHSESGNIDWNCAFLVKGSTWRVWNKEICDYLHFERSRSNKATLM